MSHLEYFNSLASISDTFFESHSRLIESICYELGQPDKIDEIKNKFLDRSVKLKPKKDPNKPKKPKTGYMIFCNENRTKVKGRNPSAKFEEIIKLLAKEWNSLDESNKEKYKEEAKDEKTQYIIDIEKYNESLFKHSVAISD